MSDDRPDNVVQLAPIRAAREEAEDDEGTDFDASTLCWVVEEGETSFVALRSPPLVDGELPDRGLDADEADALALKLVRAAARVRELRGDE